MIGDFPRPTVNPRRQRIEKCPISLLYSQEPPRSVQHAKYTRILSDVSVRVLGSPVRYTVSMTPRSAPSTTDGVPLTIYLVTSKWSDSNRRSMTAADHHVFPAPCCMRFRVETPREARRAPSCASETAVSHTRENSHGRNHLVRLSCNYKYVLFNCAFNQFNQKVQLDFLIPIVQRYIATQDDSASSLFRSALISLMAHADVLCALIWDAE